MNCVSICPKVNSIECQPYEMKVDYEENVAGTNCTCQKIECLDDLFGPTECQLDGKTFAPGEKFIPDCSRSCECMAGGSISCVSLCPQDVIECPPYEVEEFFDEKVSERCYCRKIRCKPASNQVRDILKGSLERKTKEVSSPNQCKFDGKFYKIGKSFIPDNCQGRCKCDKDGGVQCVSICPQEIVTCMEGGSKETYDTLVDGKCSCKMQRCKQVGSANQCEFNGRFYEIGESFIPDNCQGRCKCDKDGGVHCVSICPQEIITCADGASKETYDTLVDGKCSCKMQRCKQANSNTKCEFNGRFYEIGESFIPDNCQGRCKCDKDGGVHCVSICPQETITCADGASKETYDTLVDGKCSCKMQRCKQEIALHPSVSTCKHKDKFYIIGEWFVTDDCTGKCMCNENEEVHCVSPCPQENVICPLGSEIVIYDESIGGNCFCKKQKCLPISRECTYNGRTYPFGERFVPDDCSGYCECNPYGGFGCVSLCPPQIVVCQRGFIKQTYKNYITDKCFCERERCKPVALFPPVKFCYQNGKKYNFGEEIIESNCKARCVCQQNGVLDCFPLCDSPIVECRPGEHYNQIEEKIPGSDCKCPKTICLKGVNVPDKCIYKNKAYPFGDRFIPDDCLGYCKCNIFGGIDCISLCPPEILECREGFVKQMYQQKVSENCYCDRERCKSVTLPLHEKFCYQDGKKYKFGEEIIEGNCKARCVCQQNGVLDCFPLCDSPIVECRPGEHYKQIEENIPGSHCKCPKTICLKGVPEKCIYKNKAYPYGDRFVPDDCRGFCKCNPFGGIDCVSLCPPEIIECLPGFVKQTYKQKISDKCSCERELCTPEHNLNEVKLQDPQGDGETTHSKQCHRNCACLYAPVCGSDDKTYNNLCLFENAQCLDDTLTLKSGEKCEIKVEEKTNVCPENVKTFNCYKNPCDTSKCNGFPNARCRLNNCGGCKPQFFIGRMKVECKIEECPEGVPLVACSTDPCIGHSCPAYPNAKCVLNNCGGCNAEFYLTSRKVDCSMPKCQREREKLLQTNSGKILFGQYMPQCNSLGLYELMQCHEASCWCVDEKTGTKLNEKSLSIDAKECLRLFKQHKDSPETAEVKKEELKSYRIVGYVIYKPPIEKVHDNSCLFVEVRKSQHPEVLAKRKIMNPTELRISDGKMRYGIDLIDVASGEFHISATLNHGWCQDTNNKNKPSFRDGDYYTTFAELLSIRPDSDRKTHRKDITLHRVNVSETVDLSVVKVSGHVVINSDEEVSLKENSCLSIKVIDTIQCDYGLPCYPKVFGHKLYYDFQLKDNKIPYTIEIKKGNRHSYKISAVLNDGWCVNKGKWIQKGDYLSDTAHYIHRKDSDVIIYKDIEIKRYGVAVQKDDVTKKSVIVSGNVQLPTDIKTPLPKESCLHIYIQEAIYCLYCENPILAQIRITEPSITNRNIPYSIKLNLKKAKLGNFLVQSTLNIGWCGNENEWIRYNDFHNAFINEINVKEDTDKVDKDLMLERYQSKKPLFTEEADSVSVTGDVVLPYGAPISFSENSCLNMFIQEDIQCDEYCENPILTRFQLKNPQILDRRISYKLTLKKPTSGSYTIHATLNNDWCKTSQEWIRHGDYFNDIAHTFTLMENQLSHEMDVDVVLYEKKDSVVQTIPTNSPLAKPTLSGHVNIKDFQENIPKESCLQLFIQENIQCLFCHNPILSNLTIKNPKVENGKIAYKMDLPKLDEDSYTVHVMLRNGYCEDIRKPVKFDDFINNYSFTFDVRQDVAENKLNIDIEQYKQDSATEKQTSKKKYLEGKIKFSKNVDLPEGSCLKLKVQRDIQCDQPHCENPFLIKYTTKNIKINEQQIPFKVDITDLKEDLYIVEATVNQGYCGDIQAPARHGDFFNEYSVNFELKKDEHVVTTDIDVKQFVKQGCKKEEKIYEVNEIYHDNCNSCICGSDGLFRCTIMACSTGVCYHEGKEYKNDESYSKGCIDCSCRVVSPFAVGRFYCTKKFCVSDNEGAV